MNAAQLAQLAKLISDFETVFKRYVEVEGINTDSPLLEGGFYATVRHLIHRHPIKDVVVQEEFIEHVEQKAFHIVEPEIGMIGSLYKNLVGAEAASAIMG